MPRVSDLASPDLGTIRFRRLQIGLVALGVLVILAFAGSSAHDAWRSYRYALETPDRAIRYALNVSDRDSTSTARTVANFGGAGVQGREGADHARNALGNHHVRIRDDEERRADDGHG